MTPDDAWLATQGQLELQLHRSTYNTWVRDCKFVSYEDGIYSISVRNAYVKDWMEQRLYRAIKHALSVILHESLDVQFVIQKAQPTYYYNQDDEDSIVFENTPNTSSSNQSKSKPQSSIIVADPEDNADNDWVSNLNPNYTLENFVVGINNRMAYAAAEMIIQEPVQIYNPLFIHSDGGLGKTHLLHAIGNGYAAKGQRVLYTTAEQFTNHLVESIRSKSTVQFRDCYRTVDVLLVDDIQFLAGKTSSQEEFFHTFNTLHSQGKQIILVGDCAPHNLTKMEERLVSRLASGLMVELKSPTLETRIALIEEKAEMQGHHLPSNVAELIACYAQGNIRELTGLVTQVIAHTRLMGNRLTVETVEEILKQSGRPRDAATVKRRLSLETVLEAIADYEQLSLDDLVGKGRSKELVHARQLVIYFARTEMDTSLPEIGEALGGRNHSTVIYNFNKITKEMEENPELKGKIEDIRARIRHTG
jgi:chromosomal replication initiator protein